MDQLAQIAWLRRIAEKAPAALGDDGERLAAGLMDYFASSGGITLDAALGMSPQRGQDPWWAAEKRARRDAAIRWLGEGRTVKELRRLLRNYQANVWPRDRALTEAPPSYIGNTNGALFAALKEGCGKAPTSERQLRSILSGNEMGVFHCRDIARPSTNLEVERERDDQNFPDAQQDSRRARVLGRRQADPR